VLVVDDSDDSARSLARVLKLWGHKVWIVFDGPTAIETITLERFDVIILDIGLPGMDGYRVAEMIREQSLAVDSTLVALTGYGQESDFLRSKLAGFDHHLVKPVSVEQMSELLKHCKTVSP
jgi:two-component system CheB/CheR fusion protein